MSAELVRDREPRPKILILAAAGNLYLKAGVERELSIESGQSALLSKTAGMLAFDLWSRQSGSQI